MTTLRDRREQVILVDEQDRELGVCGKLEAHQKPQLHRAFSVFLFNEAGELLLQQRAACKYHSPELWSNTCCGHPRPGETLLDAAQRRLAEELGILRVPLKQAFHFIYRGELDHGMTEYELDHVVVGRFSGSPPKPDPTEVGGWSWAVPEKLEADIQVNPERYTYWFRHIRRHFSLSGLTAHLPD